jgi:glucose/arabinose dehydrogenase
MRRTLTTLSLFGVLACGPAGAQGPAQKSPTPGSTNGVVRAETVARNLVHPWALAFMPDGRMLVTERPGRLRIVGTDGTVSNPLSGVPAVHAVGQGGLLDVAVDPNFAQSRMVYLSFAEPGPGGAGTSVAKGRLNDAGTGLEGTQVIYRQRPKTQGGGHYGSRIVFGRDGTIFITQGDRMNWRDSAQSLTAGMGKIVRINTDGTIPRDNPFVGRNDAQPEIWSYGHRNLQGAALHPETGQLWTVEHGPRGGDELNHPEAGKNYGWPVIGYGIDYSGARIHESTTREGMEQPVYYWDPVIAASGVAFYTGDRYPGWKGSVLIGSMTPGALVRLEMANGRVTKEERYLGDMRERIRDVQQGPDGLLYLVTDSDNGQVLRVVAAGR